LWLKGEERGREGIKEGAERRGGGEKREERWRRKRMGGLRLAVGSEEVISLL